MFQTRSFRGSEMLSLSHQLTQLSTPCVPGSPSSQLGPVPVSLILHGSVLLQNLCLFCPQAAGHECFVTGYHPLALSPDSLPGSGGRGWGLRAPLVGASHCPRLGVVLPPIPVESLLPRATPATSCFGLLALTPLASGEGRVSGTASEMTLTGGREVGWGKARSWAVMLSQHQQGSWHPRPGVAPPGCPEVRQAPGLCTPTSTRRGGGGEWQQRGLARGSVSI